MNPGGSVKDRAAQYLIKDALEKGQSNCAGVSSYDMRDCVVD